MAKKIHESAYIDKTAVLYGDVNIGEKSSVWPNAVLRAEKNAIIIGKNSNVQDNVTIHSDENKGVEIGDNISIGHGAIIQSCEIRDNCIIGMGAILMSNVIIEDNCIIGAGALVTKGKTIPKNSLVIGIPAKVVRELSEKERKAIIENAKEYVKLSKEYLKKKRKGKKKKRGYMMQNRNIFIIHGAYGHPEENWLPWLKTELEKLGYGVFIPKFPTPEGQTLDIWLKVFKSYEKYLNESSIIIGHSLGAIFTLRLIEGLNHPIKEAFLVAGYLGYLNNKKFDPIIKTFVEPVLNWKKIKKNCKKFFVYNSDNDPYVPLEKGKELAAKLGVKISIIKNAGHFNEAAGYRKFSLLFKKKIKEVKDDNCRKENTDKIEGK